MQGKTYEGPKQQYCAYAIFKGSMHSSLEQNAGNAVQDASQMGDGHMPS